MKITYKTSKIEKVCTIASEADKKYGPEMAEKIHQRIDEIDASDTIEEMIQFHIGRCHSLKGNRKGQYAMDLVHPYRLVFEKIGTKIQIANIMEIVDYH
ncbi:type II toxin-antitoxin system RelE/ParE family toxin [Mediterraneibacter glycyrrhizinilyticus]|uniref:type II toxin-antitoxin system RelE/ParE family toxin n=1 Tax=Mediterraneibacter glycyrrhizinilyticus TaxID=342942 RepID=UPI0025A3C3FA|nr:type II toxin-antitoxin system RelE/ParE family toxin [Mediterraneibacter glycyrrhizinilyticus]MDM8212190.1 type II toxin-antitoxin system RelE/ParE family toxin [Mediterraneibacter glycyrrhizinilyticus]